MVVGREGRAIGTAVGQGGTSIGAIADDISAVGIGALAVCAQRGGATVAAVAVAVGGIGLLGISLVPPALGLVVPAAHAGEQVEQEAEDVEGEDQGDDPFEDGGDVAVVRPRGADEDAGQHHLDQDEGQFDPEADAQDAVLPVVDAQPLVLGADEHRRQDEAADEEKQEPVVQVLVSVRVEDREQDQPCGPGDGGDDGKHR